MGCGSSSGARRTSCPRRTAATSSRAKAGREAEIAKLSPRDAERYAAFDREIDVAVDVLRELVLQAPPNLAQGSAASAS